MDKPRQLAPCLIGRGTVVHFRDMVRALETVENVTYTYTVDGQLIDEGRASLVKLMADPDSASMCVNGCLFLNVASFRYLEFEQADDETCHYRLVGDDFVLELDTVPEADEPAPRPSLLLEDAAPDFESFVMLDDDEDFDEP